MQYIGKHVNKDILLKIALESDLHEILALCISNKFISERICDNEEFWGDKLRRDFPDYQKLDLREITSKSYKEIYKILYNLEEGIKDFKLFALDRYDLYNISKLNLSDKNIREFQHIFIYRI